jgi:hypothetical protein
MRWATGVSVARRASHGRVGECSDAHDIQPLPPPAVYNHCKGKPEILKDVTDPTRHSMADLMIRVRALPVSLERADVLVGGLVDLVIARRDVMRIVAQQPRCVRT